ncbi:Serine acetyltransferase [Streptococcus sp. HSISB1]|nr:Serine acetyltransferase [Streptococcus sp. HSISB1]
MDNSFLNNYNSKIRLRLFLEKDHWYYISKYLKFLRKEERYFSKGGIFYRIISMYFSRKKNSLGSKLGFYIPKNTLGDNVTIYHHGAITISGDAKIGRNCVLHGMNCIGNDGINKGAPIIGNNVDIGVGAKIIGDIKIADGIKIGANAVVTKDCNIEGATLIGIPAKILEKK